VTGHLCRGVTGKACQSDSEPDMTPAPRMVWRGLLFAEEWATSLVEHAQRRPGYGRRRTSSRNEPRHHACSLRDKYLREKALAVEECRDSYHSEVLALGFVGSCRIPFGVRSVEGCVDTLRPRAHLAPLPLREGLDAMTRDMQTTNRYEHSLDSAMRPVLPFLASHF